MFYASGLFSTIVILTKRFFTIVILTKRFSTIVISTKRFFYYCHPDQASARGRISAIFSLAIS